MSVKPIGIVSGVWYYGVECARCKQRIAVAHDLSNGNKPIAFLGPGPVPIICPACGRQEHYAPTQIKPFQAPTLN